MPPVDKVRLDGLEQYLGAPLTSDYIEGPIREGEVYVPDDIREVALYGLFAAVERGETKDVSETKAHITMLHNLEAFVHVREDGISGSELYEHQKDVFHKLYDFLAKPPINAVGEYDRRGYIKLPTGSGKTAIFTTLIDIINKPVKEDGSKLKSLVLVPKLDLVGQTVGSGDKRDVRGFARFAKDTTVTEFHGHRKDLSGDAVVMTYRSFNKLVQQDALNTSLFDIVVCDEAHNALGTQVQQSIERYAKDKLLLGVTATPDYAENKKVANLFHNEIHNMNLKEAIEAGFLAPVQVMAITSDAEIESLSKGSLEYTEKELEKLIEHEWRNQKAVEFAKSFVAVGRQGIIACVPGKNLAHPKLVAEQLQKEMIHDPVTGALRRIRAIAVGANTSLDEREKLYAAFERGQIDVLTYVDLLTEGWDSDAAKFLINLRPTLSPVNAVQRAGRVLRRGEGGAMATIVEFIDRSNKPQYTTYHALGIDKIDLRKIYGSRTDGGYVGGPPVEDLDLPDDIKQLLKDINHCLLSELIVQSEVYALPEGVSSIKVFAASLDIGSTTIMNIMEELGLEPGVYKFGNNGIEGYGLTAEQKELIKLHEFFEMPVADDTIKSIFAFGKTTGYGRTLIKNAINGLSLSPLTYRFGNNMSGTVGLNEEHQQLISDYITSHALEADESIISVNDFVKLHNTSREMVMDVLEELGEPLNIYKISERNAPAMTAEQVTRLLSHPHYSVPSFGEGDELLTTIMSEFRMQKRKMSTVMAEAGIDETTRKKGGHRVTTVSLEDGQKLRAYIAETMPAPPEGVVTAPHIANEFQTEPKRVLKLAEALGVTYTAYRFVSTKGARMLPAFDAKSAEIVRAEISRLNAVRQAATAKRMSSTIEKANQAMTAQEEVRRQYRETLVDASVEGAISFSALSQKVGISEPSLRRAAAELGLETKDYIFNGAVGRGIANPNVAALLEHPKYVLPVATDEDMTVKAVATELGVDPTTAISVMETLGISPRLLRMQGMRNADHISRAEFVQLAEHDRFKVPLAKEGTLSLYALGKVLGTSEKTIIKLATDLGITLNSHRIARGNSFSTALGLTAEQQSQLGAHPFFAIPVATEDITSIAVAPRTLKSSRSTILKIAEELEIPHTEYKFNMGKIAIGFTQEQLDKIQAVIKDRR